MPWIGKMAALSHVYAKQTIILNGAGHGGVVNDPRASAWIINLLKNDRVTER
jgi:hypothetical protein